MTTKRQRCGKPTRNGTPCKLLLSGGKCPTHDCDLSARNEKVNAAFRRNHPVAFYRQRSKAGKAGFKATLNSKGMSKAVELLAEWRISNPSGPERAVIEFFEKRKVNGYVREFMPVDGRQYSVDFAWIKHKLILEVNGHQSKPSFGEDTPRQDAFDEKRTLLESCGWTVEVLNVLDVDDPDEWLDEFVERRNLKG